MTARWRWLPVVSAAVIACAGVRSPVARALTTTFGAFNPSGTTRTIFKPDPSVHGFASNWDYWLSQPGYAP